MSWRQRLAAWRSSRWMAWFKWGWLVVVLASATAALITRLDTIEFARLSVWQGGAALGLLLMSKLLLVEQTRLSVVATGARLTYGLLVRVNALSQLAKYVPGSIWQFTSKGYYYTENGLTPQQTVRAMVTENVWLVAASLLTGVLMYWATWWSVALVAVLWGVLLAYSAQRQRAWVCAVQLSLWAAAGLSLWTLQPTLPLSSAVGAFCLSWTFGYLTVFAPGGIGTREVALLFLLRASATPDDLLAVVILHRFWWTLIEMLFGLATALYDAFWGGAAADEV